MKRLLLIVALVAPTWLYSCMPKAIVPTPADIVEQAHEAFPIPKVPEAPFVLPSSPIAPAAKPKVKHHAPVGSPHRSPVPHALPSVPRHRPPVDQAPVETLPPQQGSICIFPLNMVPQCTPETAGRMP